VIVIVLILGNLENTPVTIPFVALENWYFPTAAVIIQGSS
jgi:hypothetical protein